MVAGTGGVVPVVVVVVVLEVETVPVEAPTALLVLPSHAPRAKTDTATINARARRFFTMSAPVRLAVPRSVSTRGARRSAGLEDIARKAHTDCRNRGAVALAEGRGRW